MFPTLVRFSKASRRPLSSKRGNKDFYKGHSFLILLCSLQTNPVQELDRLSSLEVTAQVLQENML